MLLVLFKSSAEVEDATATSATTTMTMRMTMTTTTAVPLTLRRAGGKAPNIQQRVYSDKVATASV